MFRARARTSASRARTAASSNGSPLPASVRHRATAASIRSSSLRGGFAADALSRSSSFFAGPGSRDSWPMSPAMMPAPAGDDMIEVSVRSRPACSIASVCPIMPPIDAPTTCDRSTPNASSTAIASRAMSESVYGASANSTQVDCPVSRLS